MQQYYRDEARRHPEAKLSLLSRDELKEAVQLLLNHHGLAALPIYFSDNPPPGRAFRHTNAGMMSKTTRVGKTLKSITPIFFWFGSDPRAQNALFVAHEVAHYVRVKKLTRTKCPKRMAHHDAGHAKATTENVDLLRKAGYAHPVSPQVRAALDAGTQLYGTCVKGFKVMADHKARAEFVRTLDPVTTSPEVLAKLMAVL